jgi:hypothetical protein
MKAQCSSASVREERIEEAKASPALESGTRDMSEYRSSNNVIFRRWGGETRKLIHACMHEEERRSKEACETKGAEKEIKGC